MSRPLNLEMHLSVSRVCFNGLLRELELFALAFADRQPGYV